MQCLPDRAHPFAHGVQVSIIALSIMLAGCTDRLVMVERTGFNLSVAVHEDPATPLSVNAGLERRIVGVIPAKKVQEAGAGNDPIAAEEAVSLLSGFDLQYTNPPATATAGTPAQTRIGGDLTIRTQFASGQAALNLARSENPQVVSNFVNVRNVEQPTLKNLPTAPLTPTPPTPRSFRVAGCKGDECDLVKSQGNQIQQALCIKADGEFGFDTREAITLFEVADKSGRLISSANGMLEAKEYGFLLDQGPCPTAEFKNAFERFRFGTQVSRFKDADPTRVKPLAARIHCVSNKNIALPSDTNNLGAVRPLIQAFQQSVEITETGVVTPELEAMLADKFFEDLSVQACEEDIAIQD